MTFAYLPERWFNGADVRYADGTEESIDHSLTILVEGLLVDDGGYGPNLGRTRFIPWIQVRDLRRHG